jgi:zinc protease
MRTHRGAAAASLLALGVACGGADPHPSPPPRPAPVASVVPVPAAGIGPGVAPAAAPAPPTRIRALAGITEYRLDNGLTVLLLPEPGEATITVNVTYLVGSRMEGYGETGMAHLLEHLMFKGSPRFREVLALLEARGGQANGSTSTDRTNYYEVLPASPANLAWTLELEADRMRHAEVSAADLATEFSVVRNEFEQGESDPRQILDERIAATAYLWHSYGKPTIGSRADIERVPIEALRAFYDRYYQPDAATLIVAGRFTEPEALAEIRRTFGAVPRPSRALPATYTVEPPQDGERTVTLRRVGDVAAVGVAYHTVGAAAADHAAVRAALDLLTRTPSGALYRSLVEPHLATRVSGAQVAMRDPYLAVVDAEVPDPARLEQVERTITRAAEGLGAAAIDPRALERWRTAELKELDLLFTDASRLAIALSEYVAIGDWRLLFAERAQLRAITAADVQRVARAYFKPANRTVGRFVPTAAPDRAPATTTPDPATALANLGKGDGEGDGEPATATGEPAEPTLAAIDARTTRTTHGGVRAALLPRRTRGAKVTLTLRLHFGDERSLQGQAAVATLMGDLLGRGTRAHTFLQLADRQDELRAHVAITAHADELEVEVETLRAQLPGAIDLVTELLTTPSFPASELALVRAARIAALEQARQDPGAVAATTLAAALERWPARDPRAALSIDAQRAALRAVTLAQIRAFHRDLVGAGHAELAIVGDFDPISATAHLGALAGWTARGAYARLAARRFDVPGASQTVALPDQPLAELHAGLTIALGQDDPRYPAWRLLGELLGGDAGSRLWARLRERGGLSYTVHAETSADPRDPVGDLTIEASVAPTNLPAARAALREELTRLATAPVTPAELSRAQATWTTQRATNLASDAYVAALLADGLFLDRPLAWSAALDAKIAALTVDDLAAVAKQLLDPRRLVVVAAGDLAPE